MQTFEIVADETLEQLLDDLERNDTHGSLELDLLNGVLTIGLKNGQEYVINKHKPSQQIWVSSPLSGALRFEQKDTEFMYQSHGLHAFLSNELKTITQKENMGE